MTDVPKAESIIKLKKLKKPINSNKSHDGQTLLKDAKERIKRLQKKPKSVDSKKNGTKKPKAKKAGKKSIKKELKRGVVYLGHIPHGFFESEIKGFFEQFGSVTRVKVSRSPKTGKSKGYAFVEFSQNDVAQIVAETMNNYLMFERLVKAQDIPPEKVSDKMFPKRFMTEENYVALNRRNSAKARQELVPTDKKKMKHLGKIHYILSVQLKKLKEMGIEYLPQVYAPASNDISDETVASSGAETEVIPELVPITAETTTETVTEVKTEIVEESVKETVVETVEAPAEVLVKETVVEAVKETPAVATPTITPRRTRSRAAAQTPKAK